MKTVNLKEETKKARKAQETSKINLQNVIEAFEYQVKSNNLLLNALKKMQSPLSILMDDDNDFEEKAKAFNSLCEYFIVLSEIMQLNSSYGIDYMMKYFEFKESMCNLIDLDIINAIDEKSAEDSKLEYFETLEEIYDTLTNNTGEIKFVNDL